MSAGEPFRLENPAPKPNLDRFENDQSRQCMLLAGMDCLPGQLDLFSTDGEKEMRDDADV